MALLKFGSIVTEGSGSLGGHTIQHSKGGMQLRTKPIPRGTPSQAQTLIRSYNPVLQAGWRDLTTEQQKIWNDWPVSHGIFNAKGDKHTLSGHSLWMKYQYAYIIEDFAFQTDPSLAAAGPLGPELFLNGSFTTSDHWTLGASWSISGGKAHFAGIVQNEMHTPIAILINKFYRLKFNISDQAGTLGMFVYGSDVTNPFDSPLNDWLHPNNGDYSFIAKCIHVSPGIALYGQASFAAFSIDNLSLKQLL